VVGRDNGLRGWSVAAEPLPCALVLLVAELALVTEVTEFRKLVALLVRAQVGGARRSPAPESVRIDAELSKPGAHPLNTDAARGKGVGTSPGQRPPLHVPAVKGEEDDRSANLEQQGHERVTGAIEDMVRTEDGGGDPATRERAAKTEQDGKPEGHGVGAGQCKTSEDADQERRDHDGEKRTEHDDGSLQQPRVRCAMPSGV
jgi:hypothetical protein